MCGIAGVFQYKKNSFNNKAYLDWCLQSMIHRGPDSNGVWENEHYHAGFVRLAIRDLSEHGNQPMLSSCGRYVLVFNGEIYNTEVYLPALLKDGIPFKSTTDTEILLYGLIKWGAEMLKSLNGIFAFAFYDAHTNKLLLARDRMGIKPLYIGTSSEGIIYSSQYDHIINHPYCSDNPIQQDALQQYISLGYVPDGTGFFANTQLLPHGHFAWVSVNHISIQPYYSYPTEIIQPTASLEDILHKCVHQQMISDVPVGAFMSGGVDSTLVTSFASQHKQIESFTIGSNDKLLDETNDAEQFAEFFNTKHFTKYLTEGDLLQLIDSNTKAYSEPFADFSSIPTLAVSAFAKSKVTVALSGDGGDELFWGYERNSKILEHQKLLDKTKTNLYLEYLTERLFGKPKTISQRHLKASSIIDYYYQSLFIAGSSTYAHTILNDASLPTPYFLQKSFDAFQQKDDISIMNITRKMEMDLHLQRILIKVDRASMYNSLEVRVPLLDNDMLDYSNSVDYKQCIQQEQGKINLKKVLASRTNAELVYKKKRGFDIPMRAWLNNQLRNEVEEKIMQMPPHLAFFFNRKGLEKMLQQHQANTHDMTWLIWAVYTLVNWDAHHRNAFKKSVH
jgi:asparagine synthase (glutamine-hydrolysing)